MASGFHSPGGGGSVTRSEWPRRGISAPPLFLPWLLGFGCGCRARSYISTLCSASSTLLQVWGAGVSWWAPGRLMPAICTSCRWRWAVGHVSSSAVVFAQWTKVLPWDTPWRIVSVVPDSVLGNDFLAWARTARMIRDQLSALDSAIVGPKLTRRISIRVLNWMSRGVVESAHPAIANAFDFRGFNLAPVACSYVLIACRIVVKDAGSVTKSDTSSAYATTVDLNSGEWFLQGSHKRVQAHSIEAHTQWTSLSYATVDGDWSYQGAIYLHRRVYVVIYGLQSFHEPRADPVSSEHLKHIVVRHPIEGLSEVQWHQAEMCTGRLMVCYDVTYCGECIEYGTSRYSTHWPVGNCAASIGFRWWVMMRASSLYSVLRSEMGR
jgi:hypothetical protein